MIGRLQRTAIPVASGPFKRAGVAELADALNSKSIAQRLTNYRPSRIGERLRPRTRKNFGAPGIWATGKVSSEDRAALPFRAAPIGLFQSLSEGRSIRLLDGQEASVQLNKLAPCVSMRRSC